MIHNPGYLIKTPNMLPPDPFALSSELINELLTGMRLRGVRYRRIQTGPTFGLGFEAKPGHAYLHFLAVGTAVLRTSDGALHELSAGNAVLIPHGEAHALLSSPHTPAQDIDSLGAAPLDERVSGVDTCPSTAQVPSAVVFYGCMAFDLGGMQGLNKLMPCAIVVDAKQARYPGLMPILDAMKREICSGRIGFAGILARLADVVAAMIVRGWVECGCDDASGLVAALRDPRLARAILALHRQPGHGWTVAQLAAQAHISRSAFAERFQATLGIPPLRYVTELRMRLASQWLSQRGLPIEAVALQLGYTSQAAFSRAFKRITGLPPGASRQQAAQAGA